MAQYTQAQVTALIEAIKVFDGDDQVYIPRFISLNLDLSEDDLWTKFEQDQADRNARNELELVTAQQTIDAYNAIPDAIKAQVVGTSAAATTDPTTAQA